MFLPGARKPLGFGVDGKLYASYWRCDVGVTEMSTMTSAEMS